MIVHRCAMRMWIILDINYNHFYHIGKSQVLAGAWYVFSPSKPHSGTLWVSSSVVNIAINTLLLLAAISLLLCFFLHCTQNINNPLEHSRNLDPCTLWFPPLTPSSSLTLSHCNIVNLNLNISMILCLNI